MKGSDDRDPLPPFTVPLPTGKLAREANRRRVERWERTLEESIGPQKAGGSPFWKDVAVGAAAPLLAKADNYMTDTNIRSQVLRRILKQMPKSGQVVIVGHSLGSVIAADVLRRLPKDVEVAGLVTIGSPLAADFFLKTGLRDDLAQPPQNLRWWLNVWDGLDPITVSRGLSDVFPWMVDRRIGWAEDKTLWLIRRHYADAYLADDSVAKAIGFGLFGALSQEIELVPAACDGLTEAESWALSSLRFAYLISQQFAGDKREKESKYERFEMARRAVQEETYRRLVDVCREEGRGVPEKVSALQCDPGDPQAPAPPPPIQSGFDKSREVVRLLSILNENVVSPFEIEVKSKERLEAFKELVTEMHLGGKFALDLVKASEDAKSAVVGAGLGKFKWVVVGAGAAALLAATGGLALAAAPGLAGGAAVTSALAAFGPGGMVGGLLTAGTLATAGGGTVAIGLASQQTSAEAFEGLVSLRLAIALARKAQGLEQDPNLWFWFEETSAAVRRELAGLESVSDTRSKGVVDARKKRDAIRKAQRKLEAEGLAPSGDFTSTDQGLVLQLPPGLMGDNHEGHTILLELPGAADSNDA